MAHNYDGTLLPERVTQDAYRMVVAAIADRFDPPYPFVNTKLEDLNGSFHSLRQSDIDEELFDVISGFAALSSKEK